MAFSPDRRSRLRGAREKELSPQPAFDDWNPSHFLDIAEMSLASRSATTGSTHSSRPTNAPRSRPRCQAQPFIVANAAYASPLATDSRVCVRHRRNTTGTRSATAGLLAARLAARGEEPALARLVVTSRRGAASLPLVMEPLNAAHPIGGVGYWTYRHEPTRHRHRPETVQRARTDFGL